jgi:serine/threonine-protein kinase
VPSAAPNAGLAAPSGPIDPERARILRGRLVDRVKKNSWGEATDTLVALAEVDGTALRDINVREAARRVAIALEAKANPRAIPVFDALAEKFVPEGLDLLYGMVEAGGKSRAAIRAQALLARPEVLARATPEMRIAFELRHVPCNDKLALLDRAVDEGDRRALIAMETVVRRCFKRAASVDKAIATLRERLRK